MLTSLVIVNAILLKFTEQIGPYIFKRVKKNQLGKSGSTEVKVNEVIKQTKTLTQFEVNLFDKTKQKKKNFVFVLQGTYSDYLTIFEQYGYVALFSAVRRNQFVKINTNETSLFSRSSLG